MYHPALRPIAQGKGWYLGYHTMQNKSAIHTDYYKRFRCGTHTGTLFLVSHKDIPSGQALPAFWDILGGKSEFISKLRFYSACFFLWFSVEQIIFSTKKAREKK